MRRALVFVLLLAASCGRSPNGAGDGGGGEGTPTPDPTGTPWEALEGIWEVSGADAIGAYAGEVEIREDGSFTRVVRYADPVKVEGGRELWWVWQGSATRSGDAVSVTVALQRADFIVRRGALERTAADAAPLVVTGAFTRTDDTLSGTYSAEGIAAAESWKNPRASAEAPIFATARALVPAHPAPSQSYRDTAFGLFASYHEQPWVAPYVNDPRFQAAIHGYWIDTTDFAFYRANREALRVVNKVVDPISLQETLSRANAFRWPLSEKAAYFDAELANELLDPVTKMVPAAVAGDAFFPSGDGALWTGVWIAAQAFRYEVTGEAAALANVATSIDALLRLQEITGDPTTFARTLRAATGSPGGDWHAGTGPNAHLEWMDDGNNDMLKGLLYGYTTAYRVLCDGVSGYQATCQRIRTNARHLADDVAVAQNGINGLTSAWLAAYVTGELDYRFEAEGAWMAQEGVIEQGNAMIYEQGIADWSGTHLNVVQYTTMALLSEELPLSSGDTAAVLTAGVDVAYAEVADQRLPMWELAEMAIGSGDPAALADAKARLAEVSCPKTSAVVDHRLDVAEFALSPYPALPWKNDWTTNQGRAQSLNGYPLYEKFFDDYLWKDNPHGFRQDSGAIRTPGTDFSHAWWYARRFGVLPASE